MEKYTINVTYKRKSAESKTVSLECDEDQGAKSIIELLILEEIMLNEEPDLVSIQPLLKDLPHGEKGQKLLTNEELMDLHQISHIEYEINGAFFNVST